MRLIAVLVAVCLSGCATIVPDYTAHKFKSTDVTPETFVRITPNPFRNCALEGETFARVRVTITLRGQEPAPVTVRLNGIQEVNFAASLGFVVDYKAGVGEHKVEVFVRDEVKARTFVVLECRGWGRTANV